MSARRVRRSLDIESEKTLVHAFVTSRVDLQSCNYFLSSALKKVMDKLQHVQNTAARLVTGIRKYDRGLFRLMHDDLHWLVIPQPASAVTGHRCLRHRAPLYLARLLCVSLRSSWSPLASICDLPDVINCQFSEFAVAPLGSVHFLSLHQQSGIHCRIIFGI